MDKEKADMIIYTTEDGLTKVETTFDGDTAVSYTHLDVYKRQGQYKIFCMQRNSRI